MKSLAMGCALALLIGGAALMSPNPAHAAGWISGAEAYAAPWVQDVERELLKKSYRDIYANRGRNSRSANERLVNGWLVMSWFCR